MILGCSAYTVFIHTRASLDRALFAVPWTGIEYGRVLDETSEATVRALSGCCAQIEEFGVRSWSHTLAILRHDADHPRGLRLWSGPIQRIRDTAEGGLEFYVRDLSAWLDRRLIHEDHDFTETDLAEVYEAYWDDAMAPDPVPDYALAITPAGIDGDRSALATQHLRAGDELREIGRTALDWTVVDRVQVVGPQEIVTPPIALLTDEHFTTPPDIEDDGSAQANHWFVSGEGGGAEGDELYGEATASPGAEGLLEDTASEPSIEDQTSVDEAAATRLARSAGSQRFIREGTLSPQAPVDFDTLIPGARVRLALNGRCLPVRTTQRLSQVRVSVSKGESGITEAVTASFEPLGTVAA